MNNKIKTGCRFLILMGILLTPLSLSIQDHISKNWDVKVNSIPRINYINDFPEPIILNGNDALAEYCTGAGTTEDPFRIEDLEVLIGSTSGILINNTDEPLVIENCTIWKPISAGFTGIYLENCSNVEIRNNTIYDVTWGIYLKNSTHNIISQNTVTYATYYGIYLTERSHQNIVSENICNNNDYIGIFAEFSNDTIVRDNVCNLNGDGIIVGHGTLATIENNTCIANGDGIQIGSMGESVISENTCNDNTAGILVSPMNLGNEVRGNNCTGNTHGIRIDLYSNDTDITENNFIGNNHSVSIFNNSTRNRFWNNNFINSTLEQVYVDNTLENYWDNGSIGNYWSDYHSRYPEATLSPSGLVWEIPYSIGANADNYPLVNPYKPPQNVPTENPDDDNPQSIAGFHFVYVISSMVITWGVMSTFIKKDQKSL